MQTAPYWQKAGHWLSVQGSGGIAWVRGRDYQGAGETLRVGSFIILFVMMVSYAYVKTYQMVPFKYMQFIVCQFYLHKAFLINDFMIKLWFDIETKSYHV